MNKPTLMSATLLLGLLSACGGGGGGDDMVVPAANDGVPASTLASARAFSAYAGAVGPDDRAEPLRLDNVMPPTSETDEPIAVM